MLTLPPKENTLFVDYTHLFPCPIFPYLVISVKLIQHHHCMRVVVIQHPPKVGYSVG